MTRTLMIAAAFAVVPLVVASGCSSTGGCRTCSTPSVSAQPRVASKPLAPVASAPRYGGQLKCPVSGEELGSMGEPVAVTVGGRSVYVCCRGCAKRAEADPAKTLATVEAERAAK